MSEVVSVAQKFCEEVGEIPEVKEILKEFSQKFIFHCNDAAPFYLRVEDGRLSAHAGDLEPDLYNVFNIETDSQTVRELFGGNLRMADAIITARLFSDAMSKRPLLSYLGRIIRIHHENR
ncbi:MAG: hypothetical protein M1358_19510 [Chloroflexi bacterium]|nr:hypothetical protein [Chloroflexota bacterium]